LKSMETLPVIQYVLNKCFMFTWKESIFSPVRGRSSCTTISAFQILSCDSYVGCKINLGALKRRTENGIWVLKFYFPYIYTYRYFYWLPY
jgi:hypothetical protein